MSGHAAAPLRSMMKSRRLIIGSPHRRGASSVGGHVEAERLAVLRLMTSSCLVGACPDISQRLPDRPCSRPGNSDHAATVARRHESGSLHVSHRAVLVGPLENIDSSLCIGTETHLSM